MPHGLYHKTMFHDFGGVFHWKKGGGHTLQRIMRFDTFKRNFNVKMSIYEQDI